MSNQHAPIHVGIGGWTFPPWRGPFYPPDLPHARELSYASRQVTSIEINATFYGSQKPASFAKWRDDTPDDFVFSVKAPRFATHSRELAEAGESIGRFLDSGLTELGPKLGPILWQFPPTRAFSEAAMQPFLQQLPAAHRGLALRHAIEARHPSFADPAWMALLQSYGVAHAVIESDKHVMQGDVTADFVYLRLERNDTATPEGYASDELDRWAERLRRWADGQAVANLPTARPAVPVHKPRECFAYFISGDKVRAPHAAIAMLGRLRAAIRA